MGFACPSPQEQQTIKQALINGDIVMQAFPHNSETSMLTPKLFEFGLQVSLSLLLSLSCSLSLHPIFSSTFSFCYTIACVLSTPSFVICAAWQGHCIIAWHLSPHGHDATRRSSGHTWGRSPAQHLWCAWVLGWRQHSLAAACSPARVPLEERRTRDPDHCPPSWIWRD